jgi:Holliday junction resolvase-like predicted endonuclease
LRRNGYVMVARNYTAQPMKGEIDLVGWDGAVLAFVEVKREPGRKPRWAVRKTR